ncbi:unnamed protein product [Gongylonema pulchrum]|uniref:Uncharacterized protein n=1 Tax=Gongylonema pulchrum TaxID=637853 RepID=A0A183D1X3_9BILA|nr:unnamed protein product [Gongylonema pulchrum]
MCFLWKNAIFLLLLLIYSVSGDEENGGRSVIRKKRQFFGGGSFGALSVGPFFNIGWGRFGGGGLGWGGPWGYGGWGGPWGGFWG